MLVVVAMGTATVLTTAYLVSKDNSEAIGANAQNTAASEWAARSGADLALAVLQTNTDWMDADPESLLEGFTIAGGAVSVALTDLQGNPPDGTETELAMTVVADVNGVKTVLQRIVAIQPDVPIDAAVDPELGEFGIFAGSTIYSEANTEIAPWPLSPAFKSGGAVKIGAGFTSSSAMTLDSDTHLRNVELYVRPDAQQTLKDMVSDGSFDGGAVLGFKIPSIPANMPTKLSGSLPVQDASGLKISDNSGSNTLVGGVYAGLTVSNPGTTVVLDDTTGGAYLVQGKLLVDTGSVLLVKGKVSLGVMGTIGVMSGATIELADSASELRVYAAQSVTVDNAGIGIPSSVARDMDRQVSDLDKYVDPARIRFYALSQASGGSIAPWFDFKNQSIVTMVAHTPGGSVGIRDGSSLIGRVTCSAISIWRDGSFYYDQKLDHKTGYTVFDGPFYKTDGAPLDGLAAAMDSYDTTLGLDAFGNYIIANVLTEVVPVPVVNIGDPTPRSERRAREKLWPFIAKAIESGAWVTGDNAVLQDDLYVKLDPTIFNIDEFYDNGVIDATYTGSGTQSISKLGGGTMLMVN